MCTPAPAHFNTQRTTRTTGSTHMKQSYAITASPPCQTPACGPQRKTIPDGSVARKTQAWRWSEWRSAFHFVPAAQLASTHDSPPHPCNCVSNFQQEMVPLDFILFNCLHLIPILLLLLLFSTYHHNTDRLATTILSLYHHHHGTHCSPLRVLQ